MKLCNLLNKSIINLSLKVNLIYIFFSIGVTLLSLIPPMSVFNIQNVDLILKLSSGFGIVLLVVIGLCQIAKEIKKKFIKAKTAIAVILGLNVLIGLIVSFSYPYIPQETVLSESLENYFILCFFLGFIFTPIIMVLQLSAPTPKNVSLAASLPPVSFFIVNYFSNSFYSYFWWYSYFKQKNSAGHVHFIKARTVLKSIFWPFFLLDTLNSIYSDVHNKKLNFKNFKSWNILFKARKPIAYANIIIRAAFVITLLLAMYIGFLFYAAVVLWILISLSEGFMYWVLVSILYFSTDTNQTSTAPAKKSWSSLF